MPSTRASMRALLLSTVAACAACVSAAALAQSAPAVAEAVAPADRDPWPRVLDLANAQVLLYQPQVNKFDGNQLDMRAALSLIASGTKEQRFGVMFATARTHIDRVTRIVSLEDIRITRLELPALPDRGASYLAGLQTQLASGANTIALDRFETALAAADIKPQPLPVDNTPPRVIVSESVAILVPIDGAPVLKPLAEDGRFQRVINTRALILKGGLGDRFYIHVYDGWLEADSADGPWARPLRVPLGIDPLAAKLAKAGTVDLLDGGPKVASKPSLASAIPTIYTTRVPAELLVFDGKPDFVPIVGTQLLWAANTTSDVLIDTTTSTYYALLAGRWFRSTSLTGGWTFVASNELPADFSKIPPHSKAGAVLPAVAGTTQAQEAMIANSIPQTATVPRQKGPTFTPSFDGPPQFAEVPEASVAYVTNSPVPVIRVTPSSYYAVSSGVWFSATALNGPWTIATEVPAAIYRIPATSPIHYVTYVRVYGYTPQVVYVGYTPGYMGTVVTPYGTVVYGTGYAYSPWIGSVWYPPPYTYGVAAAPVYSAAVGYTFGFAVGLATAAWATPYWGGAYYHPAYWGGYRCCASASANVYGRYGAASWSGTRTVYAGGGNIGQTARGSYYNERTGTSGSYSGYRNYNAYSGVASRGYDRTVNTPAGGWGNVERQSGVDTYTGQRGYQSSVSGTGAGGSSAQRNTVATVGPQGYARAASTQTYNARTGETNSWSSASIGNNHYASHDGNVYRNTGSGWEQHSSSGGWGAVSGSFSWADRESQARSAGENRMNDFSGGGWNHGGGEGFSGAGFGGGGWSHGGGYGGRFGGGFGGGGFRGRR